MVLSPLSCSDFGAASEQTHLSSSAANMGHDTEDVCAASTTAGWRFCHLEKRFILKLSLQYDQNS